MKRQNIKIVKKLMGPLMLLLQTLERDELPVNDRVELYLELSELFSEARTFLKKCHHQDKKKKHSPKH